jgi:diguanylate cyclase (GGDEF)-like protein
MISFSMLTLTGIIYALTAARFSRTVSSLLRPEDRFVRWGGDEFLIFFHGIDLERLRMITDRLRTAINSSFIEKKEGNISITASMGTAVVEDKDALEDVVQKVDSLLYLSKLQGGNGKPHCPMAGSAVKNKT